MSDDAELGFGFHDEAWSIFAPEVRQAWIDEIRRRDVELMSGRMKTISHEVFMAKLKKLLG